MAFKDLGDWAELGGLRLPINGRWYTLPPISAELGPRVQALVDLGVDIALGNEPGEDTAEVLDDLAEQDLYKQVLGPAYDAMQADGVPWVALKHAAMTSIIDATRDREEAEKYWEQMGKPVPAKKPAKQPTDRLPRKATATRTTKASTAGTTSRRKPPAKQAQRGRRSSSSGS
ncbi:MAG TPA: hypothetical protein VIP28_11190 [Nocardioides sp.]